MPVISQVLRRLRQETCEFRITLSYNVKSCLKASKKKSCVRALFHDASWADSCVKMKLNLSIPVTAVRDSLKWMMNINFVLSMTNKCMTTEVAADALGEEWKGYVVGIC